MFRIHRALALVSLAAWLILSCSAAPPAAAATGDAILIGNAMIFDGTERAPFPGSVLIENGHIAAVGSGLKAPRGVQRIDAKGAALLPGLIDVHTHWSPTGSPNTLPQIANAYIAAGVTTVNDFHEAPEAYAPRRAWLATIAAPDVRFAARISTPLGHGADWADEATTKWVNSPAAARAAVDEVAAYQPDLIKAFTDGWRYRNDPDNVSMGEDTLAALVAEAHSKGLKVLTHTVTLERGKQAARAGVDAIAHSLLDAPVDAELIALMREHGTRIAPTLAVYEPVPMGRAATDPADKRVAQRRRNFATALANVGTLHAAGIPILVGTDAGMPGTPHGRATLHELELLVQADLTPSDALRAATSANAAALGLDDRGTIAVGKRADLVLIGGAPWQTIGDVHHIERVYIGGRQVFGPGTRLPPGNAQTALPPLRIAAAIDNFERTDGRTELDTLRTDEADGGNDRSVQVSEIVTRDDVGHALSVQARLSHKKKAYAGVVFPLSRGSLAPVDLRAFHGIRFDIRGAARSERIELRGLYGRRWSAPIELAPHWQSIAIEFSRLQSLAPFGREAPPTSWSGDDVQQVVLSASGTPGEKVWFEVDNLRFY
ncbi:MAG: amidohydrolase family protein [Proteobacteria bacterium]|uniref:amidohydrolase family protein n=1 Tax=Rudaea sp. TaxID=2136325 RepID=UPI003783E494|nr:amidohydrolase family protein [Pseudomonadota bacterium]